MIKISKVLLMVGFALLLSSCLSQLKTRQDLKGQTTPSQNPVASSTADEEAPAPVPVFKQEERNEQIRSLYGRVEESENQVRELRESMLELATSRQQEKQEAEAKLLAYEEAIKKMEAQIQELKEAKTSAPEKPKAQAKGNGKDTNAKLREDFYRGEDFYKRKLWKDAIVSYQKYREEYPKGQAYPEATYKIGMCFLQLGLKDESKSFFEEVTLKFPKSPLAAKAQKQLKSLK